MRDLLGLYPEEIFEIVKTLGDKPFRAKQILKWMYQKGASDFSEMTDLSVDFRSRLSSKARISRLTPERVTRTGKGDGLAGAEKYGGETIKFLFRLDDGEAIESVIIPDGRKRTLCVSSQVGCPLGCAFCLTGRMGFVRNLTCAEIVGQVIAAGKYLSGPGDEERGEEENISNIVFMGMGEPLLNYDEVARAVDVISANWGLEFSWRRITLSTAGIPEAILRFGTERSVNLAVSLNAPDDETRDSIMPINRRYPLKELLAALKSYPLKKGRRITLEYVLLKGINDTEDHAVKLARIISGLKVKVNLIPFNTYPGAVFERPDDERISRFQSILIGSKVNAIIRKSRGGEISAACGQLATGKTAK
ncbi:MAG: 23S rRNA (adenine(2503)-C(2))-methyltransferase RlmN [Deltaproteobacteria bacterium]|uniref:Probable dual-specificity RNA methyltransferase RlmN n=1 Tax=Candidatus Zymogenus saltonus TaxID=2844893 RepID=A0A9D8KF36_9DELT|nr:23S rRNA (adenine(2503)-C(2))-methyltransferase RlmN [Candidatus Zymogenus saltonus]